VCTIIGHATGFPSILYDAVLKPQVGAGIKVDSLDVIMKRLLQAEKCPCPSAYDRRSVVGRSPPIVYTGDSITAPDEFLRQSGIQDRCEKEYDSDTEY
jgi:hypothetical protein